MDPSLNHILSGLMWYVAFLLSTTCHEASHALAAKLGGDLTAFRGGQVTLDPWPHIRREPVGMVLVPLISFLTSGWIIGWASTPFDPVWAQRHPKRELLMSLAGPAANFSILLLAILAAKTGLQWQVFQSPDIANFGNVIQSVRPGIWHGAATFLSILMSLNLILGIFNLLPFPPLDGSSLIRYLLPQSLVQTLQQPTFSLIGLLIAWRIFDNIVGPAFLFLLNIIHPRGAYY